MPKRQRLVGSATLTVSTIFFVFFGSPMVSLTLVPLADIVLGILELLR